MTPPRTLPDLLLHACAAHPKHGVTFAEAPGSVAQVPYPALLDQARVRLAGLRTLGARKGDEVVISIALPSGFLPVFWACQLGGMVAVPAAPLTGSDDTVELERLDAICRTLRRPLVVCDDRARARIAALLARSGGDGRVVGAESLCADGASDSFDPGGPDDLAMVQFSSGSTRAPKGVALRHRNLVANCLQMTSRLSLTHHDVEVGWMPLFHDMGLIGCHIALTLVGARQAKIPTVAFLERPAVWLRAATQARATLLAGTNAALRLLLRRVDSSMAASFDLRSVRNFLVGAEPVFPAVVRATQSLLSSAGLPPTALRVAYGLAECCVGVAFDPPDRSFSSREVSRAGLGERVLRAPAGASDTYEVSEIGPAYDGCELRVVDDDDGALEDGRVGHLQVRGPQVMAGYLRDAAATEAAFCGEWLRTGDLGYVVDGRIGVCGRAKETIIVAGRNVFASDAESVAASVEGVQSAVIAAVADSEEGTEAAAMFVVLAEPDSPAAPRVLETARRKVQRVARLPLGWVVPVSRKEIPRTSSGKVRRLAMVERLVRGALDDRVARVRAARWGAAGGTPPDPLESRIRELWGRVLRMPPEAIGIDDPFLELGGASVAALEVLTLTEALVGRKLGQEMLASCSTVKQTAAWIRAGALETPTAVSARPVLREPTDGLAITAIACRFPGARDAEELHDRLLAGECRIVEPPRDRMGSASLERLGTPRGSFLEDPYAFDASFFKIPEEEARLMDPQQRLALELAAEALESAGLGEQRRRGLTIGTFLGVSATPYRAALPSPARVEDVSRTLESLPAFRALPQSARDAIERDLALRAKNAELAPTALVGNLLNMVAARVAHAFDLTGPSMAIDTACSSSLVAVHLACEALKRGECDVALAGGVHLSLDPDVWHFLKAAGVLSPTGRCVPFADGADGIVPGEGGAILVLRRWSDARAAADPVRGAILGSAIGGDGRAISPMAPNPRGQRATIEAAYRNAGVEPQSIAALEAHGTGTLIGDPIELGVQAEVFSLAPAGSIAVGSVKSNLGHLLAAAGIAGLTKMIVSLERRELPPTLHAQPPNPRLPLADSPLRIAHRRTRLDASHPLRAGVSAFGFGGTNAHVVLERAEPVAARTIPLPACALPLSAPSPEHLEGWARLLAECPVPTEPLCRELSRGRTAHAARAVRVLRSADDARRSLADYVAGREDDWLQGNPEPMAGAGRAVLLFPGQGAQSVQQARGLLECWPAFRERFTGLIEKSKAHEDLFAACYGAGASDAHVRRTDIAQPLLVAFQIALAQTVIDAGISPLAVVGHSVGELSAAAIAGAMDPAQAVRLAAVRGSLMQQRCRPGAMIAVALPADSLAPYLADHLDSLSIASLNAPVQTVVAGALDAIATLASRLERDAVAVVRIPVEHAFHSPLVLPIFEELEQSCRSIEARDPIVPLASTVHGRFVGPGELDAEYWRDHAALPVRFEEALRAAAGETPDGARASWFLEIGPGTTLSKLAKRILGRGDVRPVVSLCRNPSDRDDGADVAKALHALGSGWVSGASVDWSRFQPSTPGAFARIPSIPFRRRHLCIDEPSAPKATRLIHRWVWEELPRSPAQPGADGDWLVIGSPAADPLVLALRESGRRVIQARPFPSFAHRSDDELSLDPSDVTQWQRVLETIESAGRSLAGWVMVAPQDRDQAVRWIHASMAAFPSSGGAPSAWLLVDDSAPEPSFQATIATFAAAALEERRGRGRVIELPGALGDSSARDVIEELGSEGPSRIRLDGVRFAPRVIAAQGLSFDGPEPFRAGGSYLIIGGTGGIGSLIARRIAARGGNVVLASRGDAPAELLSALTSHRVGASHVSMDATSEASVRAAVARTIALHGAIHGVVFAAGVADGRPVSMSESEELLGTIRTKAPGAAHLARALEGSGVEWVLLTSSVAALLPALGRGLAAYAAANASLDALALRMRTAGAPWTSVSFALWRGVGMARRPGLLEAVEHAEGKAIDPAEALDALELALRCGVGHCVVADPADARVRATHEPTVRRVAREAVRESVVRDPAPGELLDDTLEWFLRRRISHATGVAAPSISPTASFSSLGLDSLASVEIARALEKRLGRPLRPTLLFENDSLARLLTSLDTPVQTPRPSEVQRSAGRLPSRFPLMPSQATFLAQNAFHPEIPS